MAIPDKKLHPFHLSDMCRLGGTYIEGQLDSGLHTDDQENQIKDQVIDTLMDCRRSHSGKRNEFLRKMIEYYAESKGLDVNSFYGYLLDATDSSDTITDAFKRACGYTGSMAFSLPEPIIKTVYKEKSPKKAAPEPEKATSASPKASKRPRMDDS